MALIKPIFSYEHLAQMPDDGKRYEIVEGELVVSPSPKRKHQRIVGKLFNVLSQAEQAGYGEAYVAPFDVVLDEHNVPQPDVFFVRINRLEIVTDDNVQGAPNVVVEVLSESTRKRDLGAKLRMYARFGVPYYWVVSPEAEMIRRYVLRDGSYAEESPLHAGQSLSCPLFPDMAIDVAGVFA